MVNLCLQSSILHLLPIIYPIFTCVDPDRYSEYGSGSKKLLNIGNDLIWIRIHNTGFVAFFGRINSCFWEGFYFLVLSNN